MLLGYYSGAAGYVPGPLSPTDQAGNPQTHIFSYFAPYAQDDIKVTQRLDSERRYALGLSCRSL